MPMLTALDMESVGRFRSIGCEGSGRKSHGLRAAEDDGRNGCFDLMAASSEHIRGGGL